MNRKQLTLLIVVAVVLSGLGWMAWNKEKSSYKDSTQKMGSKVLPNFPLNEVEQITIRQSSGSLQLAKKDDIWVVKDRGDHPAGSATGAISRVTSCAAPDTIARSSRRAVTQAPDRRASIERETTPRRR